MVIGPLCHVTIPDFGVKHGRDQDGRGGGPLQPEAGDDLGGEEGRERHIHYITINNTTLHCTTLHYTTRPIKNLFR